jgi:hypothetical protein
VLLGAVGGAADGVDSAGAWNGPGGEGPAHPQGPWLPAMREGLAPAARRRRRPGMMVCAFYGQLFRRPEPRGVADPPYRAGDLKSHQLVKGLSFRQTFSAASTIAHSGLSIFL